MLEPVCALSSDDPSSLVQIRRPSFFSGGSEAARARATRSDAHRGSPVGSEGLPPPDRVTARHPGAWCYFLMGR
ncbi:hypothetical protein SLEP1_g59670 [Rubroshorea leprosula]|uniref:Uncharacterized protein n=1 Tax=Rubroshorea leprosula TaxID=152421 RepID=A0AAV5MX38_9ROSI|nr:hypothetical protein SLEP1_g59670 [Rubroshorea leprosula]